MLRRSMLFAMPILLVSGWAFAQTPLPGPSSAPPKTEAIVEPELAKFRSAYTSGDGIAYVVIKDEKGERIYRYGDASRLEVVPVV